MRLIKPSVEIWKQETGIEGIYRQIEKVARVSYKSEDKMHEGSSKPFVDKLIERGHLSCLEHGTVYLKTKTVISGGMGSEDITCPLSKYRNNKYSKTHTDKTIYPDWIYVSSNLRVLVENDWLDDLKYLCEPTEFHVRRICAHFISDIGTMRELFRHRRFSMMQESSRFCNYSNDKFGNEITFIQPLWVHEADDIDNNTYADLCFRQSLKDAEEKYLTLLKEGWKPEQARAVLPMCTKSEAVMTGSVEDWSHLFDLRCSFLAKTGKPHPQAAELADKLYSLIMS